MFFKRKKVTVLVCGGRNYTNETKVFKVLDKLNTVYRVARLVHGDAKGADRIADMWAKYREVNVERYPAEWARYGKIAGPMRNQAMLQKERPDLVVCFPGGPGTEHMRKIAADAGVLTIVVPREGVTSIPAEV